MYNLIVGPEIEDLRDPVLSISRSRFLEYTSESISAQLVSLSNEAISCIKSWPCLVMQEGRGEEPAFLGRITSLRLSGGDVQVAVSLITPLLLKNDDIWKLRTGLDIEQFEFSRNHWAVKDCDLLRVLTVAGYAVGSEVAAGFGDGGLPAPLRSRLLEARTTIGEWGHTEIDDLLLEAGVDGLAAGREVGSRRDRANAILRFALANPGAVTAENSLLSAFIVRAALPEGEKVVPVDRLDQTTSTSAHGQQETSRARSPVADRSPNRVFVVHGRNDEARGEVVQFLTRLGLEGIVLHEQASMGRHLLTKFIEEAELVTFAVILMTDDDIGGPSPEDLQPRTRQNVILELGYFLSHLGQQRVCALITPGLETPSDFDGIVYISMGTDGRWQTELRRELVAAQMPVFED